MSETVPRRRFPDLTRTAIVLVVLLWAGLALPLLAGSRTFYLRDVFGLHLPWKAFGAEQLRQGAIPALDPGYGMGEPFRGNPQTLAFYPGNLLYLVLPLWSAFNGHYVLHWGLAAVGIALLVRARSGAPAASALAAITLVGSGFGLSCLGFYHWIAFLAGWTFALLGAWRGGRTGIAGGGLAAGFAFLAGEPILATLGLVPLVLLATERHGRRRGIGITAGIVLAGGLVALPQIVATARVLGATARATVGVASGGYALHPARLLELVLPLPFGSPTLLGPHGWAASFLPEPPLVYSLHFGVVALLLVGAARGSRWLFLALAGVALAWAGGVWPEPLHTASGGLFRYPEKFLLWPALAVPLLAADGLGRVTAGARRLRGAWLLAGAGLTLALAVTTLRPTLVAGVAAESARRGSLGAGASGDVAVAAAAATIDARLGKLAFAGALGALLAGSAALAARRRRSDILLLLQLAALLQLRPLVSTEPVAPYRERPAWARGLRPGAAVFHSALALPRWRSSPHFDLVGGSRGVYDRVAAAQLDPVPGVLYGLRYPLAPAVDRLASPGRIAVLEELARVGWPERVAWLRLFGVERAVLVGAPAHPNLRPLAAAALGDAIATLTAVDSPAPLAWWPERVVAVAPATIAQRVGASGDPRREVFIEQALAHRPGGRVAVRRESPDRIELAVDGPGGLVVVQRAHQPWYRARAGERELELVRVDLALLGVVVPPGPQQVTIDVDGRPEAFAGALGGLSAIGLALLAWRHRRDPSSSPVPEPPA